MLEAIGRVYLFEVPVSVIVKIMQLEEGAAIEVGDVMLV